MNPQPTLFVLAQDDLGQAHDFRVETKDQVRLCEVRQLVMEPRVGDGVGPVLGRRRIRDEGVVLTDPEA